jgi:hypothetical protein
VAASGTATKSPTKPKRDPKASSAKISRTGCSPTLSPTNFGESTTRARPTQQNKIHQCKNHFRYDQQCGCQPINAEALKAIREEREQMGNRKTRNKPQQNFAEQPKCEYK